MPARLPIIPVGSQAPSLVVASPIPRQATAGRAALDLLAAFRQWYVPGGGPEFVDFPSTTLVLGNGTLPARIILCGAAGAHLYLSEGSKVVTFNRDTTDDVTSHTATLHSGSGAALATAAVVAAIKPRRDVVTLMDAIFEALIGGYHAVVFQRVPGFSRVEVWENVTVNEGAVAAGRIGEVVQGFQGSLSPGAVW